LLDADAGVIVTFFDDGVLVGDSDDGCVVAFQGTGAGSDDVVAGLELDRRLDDAVRALSADGSAVVQASTREASIVDLVSGDATELLAEDEPPAGVRVVAAAFATR
jgi:hypothetical protein